MIDRISIGNSRGCWGYWVNVPYNLMLGGTLDYLADVTRVGKIIITKHEGTRGMVTVETVTENCSMSLVILN